MADNRYFTPFTVANVVTRKLNKTYFLPSFQREFEWDEDRVAALFDSLMRGYPIGTFLLWQVRQQGRQQWPAYRFISMAREGGVDNPPEQTAGMGTVTLVLDGQQRFSSLLVGLKGAFLEHRRHHSWTEADGFNECQLYIDLLDSFSGSKGSARVTASALKQLARRMRATCVDDECSREDVADCIQQLRTGQIGDRLSYCYNHEGWAEDDEALLTPAMRRALVESDPDRDDPFGAIGGFDFFEDAPKPDAHRMWFPLRRALELRSPRDARRAFSKFCRDVKGLAPEKKERARGNLLRLQQVVWQEQAIQCLTETTADHDRVVDIFVRANERGKPLTKSDILFSLVTAKWRGDARKEIGEFVKTVNNKLTLRNNITRDFVLKACLVLCDFDIAYRVGSFTRRRLTTIEQNWEQIQEAIKRCVQMVNRFGIGRDNLTSLNALLPIIYFMYKNPDIDPQSPSRRDNRNVVEMRRWLLSALLSRAFGGHSDSVIRAARKGLQGNRGGDFPSQAINREIVRAGKDVSIENLDRFTYGRRETYLALSLLYPREYWGTPKQDLDHIFARARTTRGCFVRANVPLQKAERLVGLRDRIGNLMFLPGADNRRKKDEDIRRWLKTRGSRRYCKDSLIPRNRRLLDLRHFDEFVAAREARILKTLRRLAPIGRRKARS